MAGHVTPDGRNAVSLAPYAGNVPSLLALLADFAHGPAGDLQGLTTAELCLAWRYRYRGRLPLQALHVLNEQLQAVRGPSRKCAVTGRTLRPWVPRALASEGVL